MIKITRGMIVPHRAYADELFVTLDMQEHFTKVVEGP